MTLKIQMGYNRTYLFDRYRSYMPICTAVLLDIFDSILESEYGPILEVVKSSLLDCRFVPMAKCQQLSLSLMISGWLIAQQ